MTRQSGPEGDSHPAITLDHGRKIRGVLFDFDGTLTEQGALDFTAIRREMGCPAGVSVLTYIESLEDPAQAGSATEILDRHESKAAAAAELMEGARDLITVIRGKGLPIGIITRNSRSAIDRSFQNFSDLQQTEFDMIITRDDSYRLKPDPEGVIAAAKRFGVDPSTLLLVGDYVDDVAAGNEAGAMTVFFDNRGDRTFEMPPSTWTISRLAELRALFE